MECEIPCTPVPDVKVIIAQLEIVDAESFLNDKKEKIMSIMSQVKKEKEVEYVLINCVDILNGKIVVFAVDEESRKFCEKVLDLKFNENDEYKLDRVVQRKDFTKKVRAYNYENFEL